MSRFPKIGILLLLLAIPIFLLLFFELFSTSHYEVPIYFENGIDSLPQCESTSTIHRVQALPASNALTQEQQLVDFHGQLNVVYVLPDDCRDTCRLVLEELARVQGVLENQAPLQLVLVGDSTLSNASELVQTYGQQSPEWLFLRGTEAQYGSFLQCELILPRPELPLGETLVLIDDEGRIRGYYAGTLPEEVDRLIAEIRILLYTMNMNQAHADNAG